MNRQTKIMSVLAQYPEGINFNALHREVKDVCATQTLTNILKGLEENGLLTREPKNPRKGQKVFYKSTGALQKLDKDLEEIRKLYNVFHLKLIISDYFAERGDQFKLQFNPSIMDNLFQNSIVNSILLPGLKLSTKYRGKTRRNLQQTIIDNFLALQEEYHRFLSRHPRIQAEMRQYYEIVMKTLGKEFDKVVEKVMKKGSPFLQTALSQKEKQRMVKDFSNWIEEKTTENKDLIKDNFKSLLMLS